MLLDGEHWSTEALAAGVPIDGVLTDGRGADVVRQAREAGARDLRSEPRRCSKPPVPCARRAASSHSRDGRLRPLARALDGHRAARRRPCRRAGSRQRRQRHSRRRTRSARPACSCSTDRRPGGWKALRGAMGSAFRLPVAARFIGRRPGRSPTPRPPRRRDRRAGAGEPRRSRRSPRAAAGAARQRRRRPAGRRSSAQADCALTVPMRPGVDSLNVAVTAALVLYEARRQRAAGRAVTGSALQRARRRSCPARRWPSGCGRGRSTSSSARSHLLGPGRPLRQAHRRRRAALADPLGPARHRQDDARAAARRCRRRGVRRLQRGARPASRRSRRSSRRPTIGARIGGRRTLLFVDEIHRFNKAQQDAFLPHVEAGTIMLVGATTENPSFEVNSALLSRAKVYVLHAARAGRRRRASSARARRSRARPRRAPRRRPTRPR